MLFANVYSSIRFENVSSSSSPPEQRALLTGWLSAPTLPRAGSSLSRAMLGLGGGGWSSKYDKQFAEALSSASVLDTAFILYVLCTKPAGSAYMVTISTGICIQHSYST